MSCSRYIYKTSFLKKERKQLKEWQISSFRELQKIIRTYGMAIHSGAMGSGKTIICGELSIFENRSLFIVRPKAVSGSWKEAAQTQSLSVIQDCTYERLAGTSLNDLFEDVTSEEIQHSPLFQVTRRKELADGYLVRIETRTYQTLSEDEDEDKDATREFISFETEVEFEVTEKWEALVRKGGLLLVADECQKSRNDNFFLKAFCTLSSSLMNIRKEEEQKKTLSRASTSGILLLSASPIVEKKQIIPILCMLCLWPCSWLRKGKGKSKCRRRHGPASKRARYEDEDEDEGEEDLETKEDEGEEDLQDGESLVFLLSRSFCMNSYTVTLKKKNKVMHRPKLQFQGDLLQFIQFCTQFQPQITQEIVESFEKQDMQKFIFSNEHPTYESILIGEPPKSCLFEFKNGSFSYASMKIMSCRHILVQLLFELSSRVLFPAVMQWCVNPEMSLDECTPDVANGFYHFENPSDLKTYMELTQTLKSKNSDFLLSGTGTTPSSSDISYSYSFQNFQKIEKLRLSIMVRLATSKLKQDPRGKIVLGVWYMESLQILESTFQSLYPGQWKSMSGQSSESQRNQAIEAFQKDDNSTRILLLTMKAAARGINLHDIHGHRIRYFFGSPGFDFDSSYQMTGRFVRTSAKSKAYIRFVYVALPSLLESLSSSSSSSFSFLDQHLLLHPKEKEKTIQMIRENMENRWGIEISILNSQAKKSSVLEKVLSEQNTFQKENNIQGLPLLRDFPQEIELTYEGECKKTEPYYKLLEKEIQEILLRIGAL